MHARIAAPAAALTMHGHPAATAAAVAESWYVKAKFSTVCLAAAK